MFLEILIADFASVSQQLQDEFCKLEFVGLPRHSSERRRVRVRPGAGLNAKCKMKNVEWRQTRFGILHSAFFNLHSKMVIMM